MAAMCTTLVKKKKTREKHTLRTKVLAPRRAEETTAINTPIPTKGNSFKQKSQIK